MERPNYIRTSLKEYRLYVKNCNDKKPLKYSEWLKEREEIDKCCICGKVLFINGIRQKKLCYQLGLINKKILDDGCYADGYDSRVYICKSCFSRNNNEQIMEALWKDHERTKRITKQREKEEGVR